MKEKSSFGDVEQKKGEEERGRKEKEEEAETAGGCRELSADVSKAAPSDATATASHVGGDDVYNNGERQSNFAKHGGARSHLSRQALRHI
ncbi:hypothetical protein MHYP_G00296550 [Metynnis hypsauchen]